MKGLKWLEKTGGWNDWERWIKKERGIDGENERDFDGEKEGNGWLRRGGERNDLERWVE